ncbi:bifunctional phosphopantothenoylcysteine decarboxylase/phosphopantothenate--cysteine ligase CoaBC [Bermanella marisrubri]|uniref:Coenzyme A biosynthesis bifunctional protein CoaBC n=1 Tax=Bermanella marisrubri TaxID=207949 RepID=Q1N4C8_9GAMM|nr:bifunctional phosphopantothenoylcysteine decarboxylase/phosphopantothenate--cysteine ligase CoaBC [Bermanella marisrubri]EAT12937.1 phosphopantothenoylcysteine synthase/decarboxylase [Oceanobacter sp. RED65] [Bermanella marisrubri]QIZ82932.1 bifunctional phosphopantothenoylcysteine decarboxylase/phosphopantothenate--cysteine ligase CoaBC [Bermanella marisrubri]
MLSLSNKRILLGITGGIAAYKSAELVRALKGLGAQVRVVMTDGAKEFITPLTLQALSGNPVHHSLLDPEAEAGMGHIELAKWPDHILIAPASANFIARLANGMGDDLLTTICLASIAPLAIAPAMNQAMWADANTQNNLQKLQELKKVKVWGPASGEQACGDVGLGRMLDPQDLVAELGKQFEQKSLSGKTVTITAGPTREAIDPVRYISNHSSGKMGFALAQAAVEAGANVNLICGPVTLATPERVNRIDVESCQNMYDAVFETLPNTDIFIGAAAVADYRPATTADHKIKKQSDAMSIELVRNPDIISSVAATENKPFTVGFAAETQDVSGYAKGKLISKNLDMIIANDVSDKSIGFNSEDNAVVVIGHNYETSHGKANKYHLARVIVEHIAECLETQ